MDDLVAAATIERDTFHLQIDLAVQPGESVGLTGDIGSGKSSVLWLLAGRLTPTSGVVSGVDHGGATLLTQLFQDDLVENRTGVENVADAIKAIGSSIGDPNADDPASSPEATARSILSQLGVADHVVDRLPWTFSGAEAQRVALACALAPRPSLVLLDEPTGALDKRGRAAVADYLRQWLADYSGRAVVASTNQDLLERLCDRVVELDT